MGPSLHRVTVALLVPLLLASPGCLSSSYHVAGDELSRLARTAPEDRWQAVRVTQRMLESDRPPGTAVPVSVDAPVVILPMVFWHRGHSWGVPRGWRGNPATAHGSVAAGGAALGTARPSGHASGGGGSSGRGGGPDPAVVAAMVLAAAGIVFVLAGSEGARYDGWVGVPPDEMVYLDHPDGRVSAVPLAALTPELADRAYGATLYEEESGRYLPLGRAPLNRVGFTIQSGVVTALVPTPGASGGSFGVGGRAFFGGYPVRPVGLGASADVVAGANGSLVALVGGEAQVMPLLWGGVYLGVGYASLTDDRSVRAGGWYARGGVQLELPVTTRLAASLRAGVSRLDLGAVIGIQTMPELSLGLSIY